jgi:hypothetical protein
MTPRMLHDDDGSQPLTSARIRQPRQLYSRRAPALLRRPRHHMNRVAKPLRQPRRHVHRALDTLAHCYTPHCTPRPSPYVYKRKVHGSRTEGWPRGRTGRRIRLSLSPTRTLVTPYCKRIHPPWAQDNTKVAVSPYCSPPFVSRLAPTHLGWDTQRQFTRRSKDPPGSKRRHCCIYKGVYS